MWARVSAPRGVHALQAFRVALLLMSGCAWGQPAPVAECASAQTAPFCRAVRGDRAEGWLAQSRSEVMAANGMVVTSQPLAAQAGLATLKQGGNAIDAAVATAATLSVVEPMMVGVAGDLFVVVYIAKEHKVYVLNASGTAPTGATLEHLNELGYHWDPRNWAPGSGMPQGGILAVTVPGAVWGWQEVQQRFGKLRFRQVLEPAARYARDGFPISERIAHDWRLPAALPLRGCCQSLDPESVQTWYVDGHPPRAGRIFRNPQLARTLRLLQAGGRDVFYRGEIARAIVVRSSALGGTMTLDDLAGYHGEWVEPARTAHSGYDLYELPPPSQAWATEEILGILDTCLPTWAPGATLASLGPASPQYWHLLIEAKKLAYADLYAYNADPRFVKVPLEQLLSSAHARTLCSKVDPWHASATGPVGTASLTGDTVVLSTADSEGNMVSWVNSNYSEFGSGITVPGYGFVLHDRGALFTLDPRSPNVIAPGKRPFNTLSAGFVMHGDVPTMTVTLMGGDMQAQGHAQVLLDILDLGANVQAAADMARFRHNQVRNVVDLESPLFRLVGAELSAMGHTVRAVDGEGVGGVQMILFTPEEAAGQPQGVVPLRGFYRGGSDPRKDGQAVGW
jgi:gamma-glutamyltranspeptidase/glutathione hydrolase